MPRLEILVGAALILVSLIYRFTASGSASFTVWIPAILGGLIAALGWWAGQGGGALALGGVRVVAVVGAAACVFRLVKGGFDLAAPGQQAQAITAVLCLYVLVRSWRA